MTFFNIKIILFKNINLFCFWLTLTFFFTWIYPAFEKLSHKNPRSEALTSLLYFVGVRLRQMCNCVIWSRPCQSNAESAGMPRLEILVTRPMPRITLVTWYGCFESRFGAVFGISTPCRNMSLSHQPSLHTCSKVQSKEGRGQGWRK